jgi:hypothetical protein
MVDVPRELVQYVARLLHVERRGPWHPHFGANIQAIMRPDGLPIWTSVAMPGHLHDTSCARELGVTAALNWSAAELDLPTLADSGYESTGQGIKTPVKQPTDGKRARPHHLTNHRHRTQRPLLGKAQWAAAPQVN